MCVLKDLLILSEQIKKSLITKEINELMDLLQKRKELYERFFSEFVPQNIEEVNRVKVLLKKENEIISLATEYQKELRERLNTLFRQKKSILAYGKAAGVN